MVRRNSLPVDVFLDTYAKTLTVYEAVSISFFVYRVDDVHIISETYLV